MTPSVRLTPEDMRRALAVQRGACDAPWTSAPVPGDVGLDRRATCRTCGKRVAVTARGRYANHLSAPPEELAAKRRAARRARDMP